MVILSNQIKEKMKEDETFCQEVHTAFRRFLKDDWGDIPDEFVKSNKFAKKKKNIWDKVYGKYLNKKVFIVTKFYSNKTVTVIMLANEFKFFHNFC